MHVHVGKLQGREGAGSEGRVMLGAGLCCPCAVSGCGLPGGRPGHPSPQAILLHGTFQRVPWAGGWALKLARGMVPRALEIEGVCLSQNTPLSVLNFPVV